MHLITRLLTRNLKKIPLIQLTFNYKKYKKNNDKDKTMIIIGHPILMEDEVLKAKFEDICVYIKDKYNYEELL